MLVELGNPRPLTQDGDVADLGPVVTYWSIDDETYPFVDTIDVDALRAHVTHAAIYNDGVTNSTKAGIAEPDECFLVIAHPTNGGWRTHSAASSPTWVWSDNEAFGRALAKFYDCDYGRPLDVEDTHWTRGGPPGVSPAALGVKDIEALLVNSGRDASDAAVGGGAFTPITFTANASSATSVGITGTPWVANAYANALVICTSNSGGVYGLVLSNTNNALTIDRWTTVGSPGGAAAGTPSASGTYVILPGAGSAIFMGTSTTNSAGTATDVTMAGEVQASGSPNPAGETGTGGFLRKVATFSHSAGTNTFAWAATFTATSGDINGTTTSFTVYRVGMFSSLLYRSTDTTTLWFETLMNVSAIIGAVGDALTVTLTVTTS